MNSSRKLTSACTACIALCVTFLTHAAHVKLKDVHASAVVEPKRFLMNLSLNYHSCVNNTQAPLNWCVDNEYSTPRFVGKIVWPPRTLQHYSHTGYEACLVNKVVVFIGDSRVRFQYLYLAAYLKYRKFMKCQDYPAEYRKDETCFLINQKELKGKDWTTWYQQSTKKLEDESKQYSLCDCYRSEPLDPKTTYENRYIHRMTQFGNIKLVYLQSFENLIRIDKEFPPFSGSYFPTDSQCKVGECANENRTNAFEGNVKKTMWEVLPKLNATHAFVNLGWADRTKDLSFLSCILEEFEVQHPSIQVFLMSNPYPFNTNKPSRVFDPRKLQCRCNVIDRTTMSKTVPREWYWDNMHALSILNEEFNHQLIEAICPI